jgi:hypothetical protein
MKKLIKDENGSAVVEFIIYALPLFLPLAFFITSFHSSETVNFAAQTLARNVLRIYQTGNTIENVESSVNTLVNESESTVLSGFSLRSAPIISVNCQSYPCLTPSSLVEVKVMLYLSTQEDPITGDATGYIDAWTD